MTKANVVSQSNIGSAAAFSLRTVGMTEDCSPVGLFIDTRKNLYLAYKGTVAYYQFCNFPTRHKRWHVLTTDKRISTKAVQDAVDGFLP